MPAIDGETCEEGGSSPILGYLKIRFDGDFISTFSAAGEGREGRGLS